MNKAIVLCSGGLDSITTAYYVKRALKYRHLTVLFFDYGQRSIRAERLCAKQCARNLGAKFIKICLEELKKISTSLINIKQPHKKLSRHDLKDTRNEALNWYVPCRNQIFLSYAFALAESALIKKQGKSDIFIGFKCEGDESYPDTTSNFINKMNSLSKISTIGKFEVFAPLISKDKEDIIQLATKLGINLKKTHSCYTSNIHCGTCLACRLRQEGFYWAGKKDPTIYRAGNQT